MLQTTKPIRRKAKQAEPHFVDPATIDTRFYGHQLVGTCLDPVFKDGDMVVLIVRRLYRTDASLASTIGLNLSRRGSYRSRSRSS
jgi:hypothetical protein